MAVRNFWADITVDGRKTKIGTGPRAKDGGMEIKIYQRSKGEITLAYTISCGEVDGRLFTNVMKGDNKLPTTYNTTER